MPPRKTKTTEKVEWTYQDSKVTSLKDMPPNVIGIIYRIENLDTKKYYIGRKTVASIKKKKLTIAEKKLEENKRKTFKYEYSETNGWETYCGSNTTLKEEVKNGARIKKIILHYCFTKTEMSYKESAEIICSGSLEDEMSYNDWVSCRVYKANLIGKNSAKN